MAQSRTALDTDSQTPSVPFSGTVPVNPDSAGPASSELDGKDPGMFGGPQIPSEALDASAPDASGDTNASAPDSSGAPSTENGDAGGGSDGAAADSGDAGGD